MSLGGRVGSWGGANEGFPPSRNLSNNRIKEVREGAFDGAASVQELVLTGNQLETTHGRAFRGLSGLKTL